MFVASRFTPHAPHFMDTQRLKRLLEEVKSGEMPVAPGGKPPFDERVWEFIRKAGEIRKAK